MYAYDCEKYAQEQTIIDEQSRAEHGISVNQACAYNSIWSQITGTIYIAPMQIAMLNEWVSNGPTQHNATQILFALFPCIYGVCI